MNFVLDTNVVIAGLRSPTGASAALLLAARNKKYAMLASVGLFIEYEAVLKREEHLSFLEITKKQADQLLDAIATFVKPVRIHYLWRPTLKDPKDDMVLECAVNGGATSIVTFNTRDFLDAAEYFEITTLLPRDALGALK
jgi:putative PIN family toxin of toxin-antitoxin system